MLSNCKSMSLLEVGREISARIITAKNNNFASILRRRSEGRKESLELTRLGRDKGILISPDYKAPTVDWIRNIKLQHDA